MTADSSPLAVQKTTSSAESNFRELDDAYLQTQARIWLGEVLQIRFDEQVDISELLADGELLFEVSEVISRMLSSLSVDETQLKVHEWKTLASNKSTRRYMHYYNVDSFLRMCKNLGMNGIDLFTPTDVVERRSTRKVCMCLRSLSKLSRLRDLNVPDFDSVTCTLTMPTDMVECIRKSLEMSQSSSSLSVEQEVEKASRIRYWERMSNSASAVSSGYSDNCDEAESRLVVAESYGSSDDSYDVESPNISGSQLIRDHKSALPLSIRSDFNDEEDDQCEYLSPSKVESIGSPCSQYFSDEELNMASSNCLGSRVSGKLPELGSDIKIGELTSDDIHIPIDWGNSHLDVGNCNDTNRSSANDVEVCVSRNKGVDTTYSHDFDPTQNDVCDDGLATSNNPSGVVCDDTSELFAHSECVVTDHFHVVEDLNLSCEDASSYNNEAKHELLVSEVGANNGEPYSNEKNDDKFSSNEQATQNSCVSRPSEKPDLLYNNENQVSNDACTEIIYVGQNTRDGLNNGKTTSEDVGDQLRCHEEQPPCSVDYNGHCCNGSSLIAVRSTSNDGHWDGKEIQLSDHLNMPHTDLNSSFNVVVAENNINCSKDCHDVIKVSEGHNDVVESVDDKPIDIVHIYNTIPANSFTTSMCDPLPESQSPKVEEDTDHNQHLCVKDMNKGETKDVTAEAISKDLPLPKPQKKLLKSFVKGTAVLGVTAFLLHLRKSRQENLSKAKKRPADIVIQGTLKPTQTGGNTSSVYPAEKLNLGM